MGTSPTKTSVTTSESKSSKQSKETSPRQDSKITKTDAAVRPEGTSNVETSQPLAPPPKPSIQQTPDYFSSQAGGSLSLEPNPFEQSFGGGGQGVETPGGTKLPSVAALTSPSSLLPGTGTTPFPWPGSLRTGPLSPAMLSGPTTDYFSDHLRGGFPTPNESGVRTGLTPGGSGSMFPAPSPNTQALFNHLAGGGATPSTLEFRRTAISAAAKRELSVSGSQSQQAPAITALAPTPAPAPATAPAPDAAEETTTDPASMPPKPDSVPAPLRSLDTHDNDAANGLFMLAQGRNGTKQAPSQFPGPLATEPPKHFKPAPAAAPPDTSTSPQMSSVNGGGSIGARSARGVSEAGTAMSDESEQAKPVTKGKAKRNGQPATVNGRRKADDAPAKAPATKKTKFNPPPSLSEQSDDQSDDESKIKDEDGGPRSKMTEEEKRKNFLERNRVAALKCRQRKKQWLANLQNKVELYSTENDALTAQIGQLREEVINLKTLLMAHKDCPVTQQQGLHSAFIPPAVEPFSAQMNPYNMAAPMPNQSVIAGQSVRRFS